MPETRKHERLPISLRVRFRSATLDEFVEKYAQNISNGGLFIQSRSPMPVGTLIKFEFRLTDESRVISGVGRIVWSRGDNGDDGTPTGMGVKFIKVDPTSRERITDIVDRRGGGEGVFDEQDGESLSRPQMMPAVPPKGLANSSNPPPPPSPRHPDLHGLADSDSIHAPVRTAIAGGEKRSPREARPSLAAALMSPESPSSSTGARSESLPAGLAPDSTEVGIEGPPSEAPIEFSEPPQHSIPPTSSMSDPASIRPPVTGKTMDGMPDPSLLAAIEEGAGARDPSISERPQESGMAAIESALADSLDDEPGVAGPSQPALLAGAQDASFGIGVGDIDEREEERPQSIPPEPASPPTRQSRLLAMVLALVLVALMGAMLFFWFNPGALGGAMNRGGNETNTTKPVSPEQDDPPPAVLPAATTDAAMDSVTEDGGAADASGTETPEQPAEQVAADDKVIKTRFSSNVRGATFSHAGATFEQPLELPQGTEVVIKASAPGYKTTEHKFVPGPGQMRQRITLAPLPHVLKITSSPAGASVSVAGKNANAPAELVFDGPPKTNFVVASLPGHVRARVRIDRKAFEQIGEQMVQSIDVTLRPKPKPRPRPTGESPAGGSEGGGSAGGGSEGGGSAGDVPDNPF